MRYIANLYEIGTKGRRLHVYLGRLLIASQVTPLRGPTQALCVLTDDLGSILAACDTNGAIVHQQIYSPFGLDLKAVSPMDSYIGKPFHSEFGLACFGARYYAPTLPPLITPDWFIIERPERALRLPQGLNPYSYAVNNPLTYRDPSGLWFGIDDLYVVAAGFVVGMVVGTTYGPATGRNLGESLLRGFEAGVLGGAGAWLAYNTTGFALGKSGFQGVGTSPIIIGSPESAVGTYVSAHVTTQSLQMTATMIGAANGIIGGMTRIYSLNYNGLGAFVHDSTWGLVGTVSASRCMPTIRI